MFPISHLSLNGWKVSPTLTKWTTLLLSALAGHCSGGNGPAGSCAGTVLGKASKPASATKSVWDFMITCCSAEKHPAAAYARLGRIRSEKAYVVRTRRRTGGFTVVNRRVLALASNRCCPLMVRLPVNAGQSLETWEELSGKNSTLRITHVQVRCAASYEWYAASTSRSAALRSFRTSHQLDCGRDIALRCPRPRNGGRTRCTAARGAEGAARHPYQVQGF